MRNQRVPRVHVEKPWSAKRSRKTRISPEARKILRRIESLRSPIEAAGLDSLTWTMSNPQPRFYGQARFFGRWKKGTTTIEAVDLPPTLQARRKQLEEALAETVDIALGSPMPSTQGMLVDSVEQEGDDDLLVLTPIDGGEGDQRTEVHVSKQGFVKRIIEHQFGTIRETHLKWRQDAGNHLLTCRTSFDPRNPAVKTAHEVRYALSNGSLLPERITLHLTGRFPRGLDFEFAYPRPAGSF